MLFNALIVNGVIGHNRRNLTFGSSGTQRKVALHLSALALCIKLPNRGFTLTINHEVKLGPLTETICRDASWRGKDEFPSSQLWADEVERVLSFLEIQGQFGRYLPMLGGKLTQRDGALAEARVAFFFHRNGFQIVSWHPKGASNRFGEFQVQWHDTKPIFVEVKGPRWEGELNDHEKFGPRRQQPRYINGEARFVDSVGKIIDAAEKAIPKFPTSGPNLLVVVAYLLFVSPRELPRNILEPQLSEHPIRDSLTLEGSLFLIFTVGMKRSLIKSHS